MTCPTGCLKGPVTGCLTYKATNFNYAFTWSALAVVGITDSQELAGPPGAEHVRRKAMRIPQKVRGQMSGARLWELTITSLRCQTSLLARQNKWPQSQVVGGPVIPAYPPTREGTRGTSEAFAMQATDPTCLKPIHQNEREGESTSETVVGVSCQCPTAEGSSYQVHYLLDPEAGSPRPSCGRAGSPEAALLYPKMNPHQSSLCVS